MFPPLSDLRRRRIQTGLTQGRLARLSGVSQSLVAKIERGKVEPSYRNVVALYEALERLGEESSRDAPAGHLATRPMITVRPRDRLTVAAHLMRTHGVSQLPVVEGEYLVGSLTDRRVVECMADHGPSMRLGRITVGEIMQKPFPSVDASTPGGVAAVLLKHAAAVLITERGKPVGILTQADLFRGL